MSVPPGFLDELRGRLSMAQVAGRKVVWDMRKSNQSKGDMWAPCPFHQEKTASFHVDDRKGFYYCFGCHAKGDAISFVRETENAGFMEAVEILAREAGMAMPARDPMAQERADRRTELAAVMEQAVRHYRMQLKTTGAASARDYLLGRGLTPESCDRWEIGFASENRRTLFETLVQKGVREDLIVEAGLAARPDDGGAPYDRFRGRILFPIRDPQGKAIALGGRAMDPNARAKYLNSPETPLFDKGRSLYNLGPAREAVGPDQPLIVAEGYMDVIALCEAGFRATVAPLGTAITEDQLQLMWRIHSEPVIALDGDAAGLRAAMRVIDIALPMLEAGQSLRFAIMPEGQDPDDLLKSQGRAAMQAVLDQAMPMVQLLWRRETDGKVFDSPERRAALDRDLRAVLAKITDRSIRGHYGEAIRDLRRALFGGRGAPQNGGRPWAPRGQGRFRGARAPEGAAPSTKASLLAAAKGAVEDALREAVILASLVTHPDLTEQFAGELEAMDLTRPEHEAIRTALLAASGRVEIEAQIGPEPLEKLFSARHVQIAPPVRNPEDKETAVACIAQELAKLSAGRGRTREIEEAVADLGALADEGLTWRLVQAAEAVERAGKKRAGTGGEFDVAPNGVRLNREERNALEDILRQAGVEARPGRSDR